MIHETTPEQRRRLLAAQMETVRCREQLECAHALPRNHFSILALPILAVAIFVNLVHLGVGFYAERAPTVTQTPVPREQFLDRQFLASLNFQRPIAVDFTQADKGFLSALVADQMTKIPRATFVAPPRKKSPAVEFNTSVLVAAAAEGESVIPRAIFVAPPRYTSVMATERVASGIPRRSSIFIYEGKVVIVKR